MKKCLITPDSFKGTLGSIQICEMAKKKILEIFPSCVVHAIPVADGGEGTVDCFLYTGKANKVSLKVRNAFMEETEVYYARMGKIAVIEMAQAAGLPQVEGRENPMLTTTYGVGEMMAHALNNGCTEIILGLGGSCTNDGGAGAACALGCLFFDRMGKQFLPTGGTLHQIDRIDNAVTKEKLSNCKVTAMCDVNNPLYGEEGAAYIFGPQKGADEDVVKELDENLRMLSGIIKRDLGIDVSDVSGAGAAGGFGAGVIAFFDGVLKSGIDTVLDLIEFEKIADGADLIFTGEGKIDNQSLDGKVIVGIGARAKNMNIPVIALTGFVGDGGEGVYERGISSIFSINRKPEEFSVSRYKSEENFLASLESILRFYKAVVEKKT